MKFNVAKVLQSLIPILDQSVSWSLQTLVILFSSALCFSLTPSNACLQVVEKTVKPCLVELSEDPDVDVRYYANQALQACDQMVMSS
jgi:serine/threonine-protein phosphatase 2A regulatory subunit A